MRRAPGNLGSVGACKSVSWANRQTLSPPTLWAEPSSASGGALRAGRLVSYRLGCPVQRLLPRLSSVRTGESSDGTS